MEKQSLIELGKPRMKPVPLSRAQIKLTRDQIFRMLREENLGEIESGQAPVYTQYVHTNLS